MRSAPAASPPWLVGPWIDGLLVGGASIAAYAVILALNPPSGVGMLGVVTAYLVFLSNGAHFSATVHRLYGSPDRIRQYPWTALLVPLPIAAATWLSLGRPDEFAPYFAKLYLLWSPYHYSGQTVGITRLYARRAGVVLEDWELKALTGFVFGIFVAATARMESGLGWQSFLGMRVPSLGVPVGFAWAAEAVMALFGLAFVFGVARRIRAGGGAAALWPLLLPAAAQFVWFIPGSRLPAFTDFVPFFHGAQYLLIAWYARMQEEDPSGRARLRETARWAAINTAGNYGLFIAFPHLLAAASGRPLTLTLPIAFAAVQIHHFFVDGVIWKLRDKKVAAPLLKPLAEPA